jgi:hypothetical protein
MDYRKLYKEFYEIEFPTSMEVHHINGDREDNSIHNLLLLPKDTHNKMHYCNGLMDGIDMSVREMAKRAYNLACKYGGQSYDLMAINEFSEVMLECTAWGLLKHLEYRKPSGEKITNIDESAIKWITTRG